MLEDLEKILNPEQLEAATAGDGPLLILAAAGTGKTQTLVYRVAHLVERGVEPSSILLLTFTNKAANEMLERARTVVGPSVGSVWSGTFHHVCNRILRTNAAVLGYRENFAIADRTDSRSLIAKAMAEVGVGGDNFPKRDVLASFFGNAANRCLPLEEVLIEKYDSHPQDHQAIIAVHEAYERIKFDAGAMDFDDLLVNCLRLFEAKPEVLDYYRRKFRYILVDEDQDTNTVQSKLVDLLGAGGNVTAVGDDFQCIYTWRGADFRNIMDFPRRYPGAKIVKLERNYRSTPEILDVANASIAHNRDQFDKQLKATRSHGSKPAVFRVHDGVSQSVEVVKQIRNFLDMGFRYSDIAVLYRSHYQSIDLQMLMSKSRLPFLITSGVGVFETAHVKDFMALLHLIDDPRDAISFERLFLLLPKLGQKTAEKLWERLGRVCDLSTEEGRMRVLEALPAAPREAWKPISALIARYFEKVAKSGVEDVPGLASGFIDNFYQAYLEKNFDNPDERIDDISEVGVQIGQCKSLREFLQTVALNTNAETEVGRAEAEGRDVIRLSTVHQAKGLEWPVVFIIWANEDMFPSSRAIGEQGDDSEERRLFYVAVTRAKKHLEIFMPNMRKTFDGGTMPCKPSRFVKEIPPDLLAVRYGAYR